MSNELCWWPLWATTIGACLICDGLNILSNEIAGVTTQTAPSELDAPQNPQTYR